MLAKKKSLIFCLLETGGGRGGGKIKIVFINPKMSDFFLKLKNRKKSRFSSLNQKLTIFSMKKKIISKSSQKFQIGLYLEFYPSADLSISKKLLMMLKSH